MAMRWKQKAIQEATPLPCLEAGRGARENGCFRALLACFGGKTAEVSCPGCLLRRARRQPRRQRPPRERRQLDQRRGRRQGNPRPVLGGKRLSDAIEPHQHVIAQHFERAPPALIDPGEDSGTVSSAPVRSPAYGPFRQSFRPLVLGCSPRAACLVTHHNRGGA
jgi:hypothetical protein